MAKLHLRGKRVLVPLCVLSGAILFVVVMVWLFSTSMRGKIAVTVITAIVAATSPVTEIIEAKLKKLNKPRLPQWVSTASKVVSLFAIFFCLIGNSVVSIRDDRDDNAKTQKLIAANNKLDYANNAIKKANNKMDAANTKMDAANDAIKVAKDASIQAKVAGQSASKQVVRLQREQEHIQSINRILAQKGQSLTIQQGETTRLKIVAERLKSTNIELHNVERTLNPIQNIVLTFEVRLPLESSLLHDYNSKLETKAVEYVEYIKHLPAGSDGKTPDFDGLFQLTDSDNIGLVIHRGSELFPQDRTKLPGKLFSYQLKMLFWKEFNPASIDKTFSISRMPLADAFAMTVISYEPDPVLVYTPKNNQLHIVYENAMANVSKTTGKILTIPDLIGAHVLAMRNTFRDDKNFISLRSGVTEIERQCFIDHITVGISGRNFIFRSDAFHYCSDLDHGTSCQFTFRDTRQNYEAMKDFFNN